MTATAFAAQTNVSRETLDRLTIYAELLRKWNPKINLVAKSTLPEVWSRHFLDSAQVLEIAGQGRRWVDIGTGGGFPGVVVAILAMEVRPDLTVTCIESDGRKAAFLRTVLRETGVDGSVIASRIEEVEPQGADILSARALAPLDVLLSYASRHLKPDGEALFLKGADHEKELSEALETWSFRADKIVSKTNPEAVVLKIGGIERG
ncbi:16S rRNA (guanine(527)-N(7))-methyltransferase RsmG [uncultured Maritimibacter sp.]|jgi:16S rRNA (guanine527-N7)-methyltransferase|uniref:16S rRNA (guanine(527)-N(7))-methyltransferase RsmG n=1 Tax=uncultured Maritimibacter sp. TaxID=991866 RepID=UPI000AD02196|nr:16S rRNA (guanine(527)-N(7))-methyltransferase RsmG [uncultured Maritimibacter sp.]